MKLMKINKKIISMLGILAIAGAMILPSGKVFAATTYTQTLKSGISSFPKEYQTALKKIQTIHPNWNFEAYYTGIPWNTVVLNETASHGRNRVHKSSDASWKCSCGNVASGYACASEGIIKYYLDPRNFLNEINVFQFLEISYNASIHNRAGVQSAVKNTFLNQTITYKKDGKSYKKAYVDIILDAAKASNMSPYSIVTKIVQEVGSQGSSSVSGTYKGYEGYYNFFNLGAYDTGNAIVNALKYAKDRGWDNQYDSIVEGAQQIANSYTNAGQNTAYFYKWDVVGTSILKVGKTQKVSSSSFYWHQYMTNVQDPTSQSKSLYNTYASNGILEKKLNFIIPVYDSMPGTSGMPSGFASGTKDLYYVNCTDGLRVRGSASTSGEVLASLNKNAQVQMLVKNYKQADGFVWDEIKMANGKKGYAADKYLMAVNASSSTTKNTTTTNTSTSNVVATAKTAENLKMRKTASTSGVLVTTIPKGKQVDILKKDAAKANGYTWYQVKYDSKTGYVASKYLTSIKDTSTKATTNTNTNNSKTSTTTTKKTTTTTTEVSKTTEKVNLRKTASTSGKVLTKIPKGKKVTMVKKNAKKANGYTWHQVKYDGKMGYVASKYIKITKEKKEVKETKTSTKKETTTTGKTKEKLKLRKTASTSGKVLTTIPKGKKVTIVKKNAKKANGYTWHQVKYSGKTGYVVSKYIK